MDATYPFMINLYYMNRGEQTLKLVKAWIKQVGPKEARLRLSRYVPDQKIGSSTIQKLVKGKYESTPGHELTELLLKEMAHEGFTLAG